MTLITVVYITVWPMIAFCHKSMVQPQFKVRPGDTFLPDVEQNLKRCV